MATPHPTADNRRTRFAVLSRPAAVAVLAAVAVAAALLAVVAAHVPGWPVGGIGVPDKDLYRAVTARVHNGENYYDALADQFRGAGPGAGSVFNWRLPTYAWLLGALPDPDWGRGLLLLLAALSVAAVVRTHLAGAGLGRAALVVLLLLGGAFAWGVYEPDAFYTTEPWCEALILLSLAAFAAGRGIAGALLGLAALALRELALPYCLTAAAVAAWKRRWRELGVWAVGLAVAAAGFALHAAAVERRRPDVTATAVGAWVGRQEGAVFVCQTAAMNLFLRPLPLAAAGVYLPVALLGLAGWRGEQGIRLLAAAGVYVAAFAVAHGGPYWGMLYAPVLVLGLSAAPAALRDLWASARANSRSAAGRSP